MTDHIQQASDVFRHYSNRNDLLLCFQHAASVAEAEQVTAPCKQHMLHVLAAMDAPDEINTFAELYAESLHELGITEKRAITMVEWQDLADHGIPEKISGAFKEAAGGLLLITKALETPERANLAYYTLCEQMNHYHQDTPVVVMAGPTAPLQKFVSSYETVGFHFPNKIGF